MPMAQEVAREIVTRFNELGHLDYGERVTLREHMLQSAVFAERDHASDMLVVAALLHDIGHLLHGLGEDIADRGIDGKHEDVGADYLARYFPPQIVEPTRLHVAAKRFLCATDASYLEGLSDASRQSLALQGGPFSPQEAEVFSRHPYFESALKVRRYDEAGKVPGMVTPTVSDYRPLIERAVLRKS